MKAVLARPGVSRPVTAIARPLARWLPNSVLYRLPVAGPCTVEVPGSKTTFQLEVGPADSIATAVYWHGLAGYEPHTMRALVALTGGLASFIDVGANVGIYSLLMAAIDPAMPVHAVEPVPAIFARLRRNAELNRFSNLSLHELAVSDTTGETVIHVPVNQRVPIEASLVRDFRPDTNAVPVRVSTVDDLVAEIGIREVGLLKVDTEGTTRRVLEGARATLQRDAPFVICEVLCGWDDGDGVSGIFADLGYRSYRLTERGPQPVDKIESDPRNVDVNFLFVHRERVHELPSQE